MQSWLEISLGAVARNARRLAELAAPARMCAVVKSNAYGHGLASVSSALARSGIAGLRFGVFSCAEAAALRDARVRQPVFVMGPLDEADLPQLPDGDLEFALLDEGDLELFARHRLRAHVKVETGTRRFGVDPVAATRVLAQAADAVLEIAGIYSHLANAEDLDESYTMRQLDTLKSVAGSSQGRPLLHIAASAAAMMWPQTRLGMVRCGIALYGAWPSPEVRERMRRTSPDFTLEPALRWFAPIVQIKEVPAGEPVGYGCAFTPARDSTIAVLPLGYADGLPRAAGNAKAAVTVGGQLAPVVGRVCMNACMLDVTDVRPRPARSEVVEFDVEQLADAAGTINYEILARLSPSLERRYSPATDQTP